MNKIPTTDTLEHEHLGRLMCRYAIPCMISLLVAALYNIVDQVFIANADDLGSYGNAANTVVVPLTVVGLALLLPVFFGLDGVLYSMPVADALTFLISLAAIIHTYRGLQRAMDAQTLPAQGDRSAGRS